MFKALTTAILFASAIAAASLGIARGESVTNEDAGEAAMTKIKIIIDDEALSATLDNTAPGRDFADMLPLELTLSDYHGIEKIADLPRELDSTDAPASYKPETGDITVYAPWGNLAIFYKPFQNSRGLVRLGEFDGTIDALLKDEPFRVRIERVE